MYAAFLAPLLTFFKWIVYIIIAILVSICLVDHCTCYTRQNIHDPRCSDPYYFALNRLSWCANYAHYIDTPMLAAIVKNLLTFVDVKIPFYFGEQLDFFLSYILLPFAIPVIVYKLNKQYLAAQLQKNLAQ